MIEKILLACIVLLLIAIIGWLGDAARELKKIGADVRRLREAADYDPYEDRP